MDDPPDPPPPAGVSILELAYHAMLRAGALAVTPANESVAPPDPAWSKLRADLETRGLDAQITRAEADLLCGVDGAARRLRALRGLRAMRSFERGERDAAYAEWEALAAEDPMDADPLKTRSLFFASGGAFDTALDDLNRAAARAPGDPEVYRLRGGLFARLRDRERALLDYRRLVHLRPRDIDALADLASALRFSADPDGAIRVLGRAIRLAPWRAELYAARADCFMAKRAYREQILDLDCCIERDPTNVKAFRSRASAHESLGDEERRLADLSRAIELDPTDAGTLHSRALIHKGRGLHEEALADLSAAIALKPHWAVLRLCRAELDLENGAVDRALADLELVIEDSSAREEELEWRSWGFDEDLERDPVRDLERERLARPYWLRGHARRRLGDREGALTDYDHALRLSRRLLREAAWSARRSKDRSIPAQMDLLDTLILVDAEEPEWPLARAKIWVARDNLAEARADVERALAADPRCARAFALLADVCRKEGDDRAAIVALSRAIELDPLEPVHFMWRGLCRLMEEGPSPDAEDDMRCAVAFAGEDREIELAGLAIYLEHGDRWAEALAVHDERIEIAPRAGKGYVARALVRLELGRDEHSLRAALADLDAAIERGIEDAEVREKRAEVLALLDSRGVRGDGGA